MSFHRDYAEHLLENPPVDPLTGRHSPLTAIAHAVLALVDKLEEVASVFISDEEEE